MSTLPKINDAILVATATMHGATFETLTPKLTVNVNLAGVVQVCVPIAQVLESSKLPTYM